jgi:hypothetical protein
MTQQLIRSLTDQKAFAPCTVHTDPNVLHAAQKQRAVTDTLQHHIRADTLESCGLNHEVSGMHLKYFTLL